MCFSAIKNSIFTFSTKHLTFIFLETSSSFLQDRHDYTQCLLINFVRLCQLHFYAHTVSVVCTASTDEIATILIVCNNRHLSF